MTQLQLSLEDRERCDIQDNVQNEYPLPVDESVLESELKQRDLEEKAKEKLLTVNVGPTVTLAQPEIPAVNPIETNISDPSTVNVNQIPDPPSVSSNTNASNPGNELVPNPPNTSDPNPPSTNIPNPPNANIPNPPTTNVPNSANTNANPNPAVATRVVDTVTNPHFHLRGAPVGFVGTVSVNGLVTHDSLMVSESQCLLKLEDFTHKDSYDKTFPALLTLETNNPLTLNVFKDSIRAFRNDLDVELRKYFEKRGSIYSRPRYKEECSKIVDSIVKLKGPLYCYPSLEEFPASVVPYIKERHTIGYGSFNGSEKEVAICFGCRSRAFSVVLSLHDSTGKNITSDFKITALPNTMLLHEKVEFTNTMRNGVMINNVISSFTFRIAVPEGTVGLVYFKMQKYGVIHDVRIMVKEKQHRDKIHQQWKADAAKAAVPAVNNVPTPTNTFVDFNTLQRDYQAKATFLNMYKMSVYTSISNQRHLPIYNNLFTKLRTMTESELQQALNVIYDFNNAKVVQRFNNSKSNTGIETGTQEFSLDCPYTLQRMKYPGIGIRCTHKQCFDLMTFFELRSTGYVKCAYCSNSYTVYELKVDFSFMTFLAQAGGQSEVYIESDGTFSFKKKESNAIDVDGPMNTIQDSNTTYVDDDWGNETSNQDAIVVESFVKSTKRKREEDVYIVDAQLVDDIDDCVIIL